MPTMMEPRRSWNRSRRKTRRRSGESRTHRSKMSSRSSWSNGRPAAT
jgi:hypothetical protein